MYCSWFLESNHLKNEGFPWFDQTIHGLPRNYTSLQIEVSNSSPTFKVIHNNASQSKFSLRGMWGIETGSRNVYHTVCNKTTTALCTVSLHLQRLYTGFSKCAIQQVGCKFNSHFIQQQNFMICRKHMHKQISNYF